MLLADELTDGVATIDNDCWGLFVADRLGLVEAETDELGIDDADSEVDCDPDSVKPGETVLIEDGETDWVDI